MYAPRTLLHMSKWGQSSEASPSELRGSRSNREWHSWGAYGTQEGLRELCYWTCLERPSDGLGLRTVAQNGTLKQLGAGSQQMQAEELVWRESGAGKWEQRVWVVREAPASGGERAHPCSYGPGPAHQVATPSQVPRGAVVTSTAS